MNRLEQIQYLNSILLEERPYYKEKFQVYSKDIMTQRKSLRCLMNLRSPQPLRKEFLAVQDQLLSDERKDAGFIDAAILSTISNYNISLWQGDITQLKIDAIVNAANKKLLGCFYPCHACIDNVIHSAAGLQLREECNNIMNKQGHDELTGRAKITNGYNLLCRYVIHTVGPIIQGEVTIDDERRLADCYRSCMELAEMKKIKSIAFCCISTGEFHFPNEKAAEIAVQTVKSYLKETNNTIKVVFNVFKENDYAIYRKLLGTNSKS